MKDKTQIQLEELSHEDIPHAVALVHAAMNPNEAQWAQKTFDQHFTSKSHNIDDGRSYFIHKNNTAIIALTGLHHYNWGPPQNVWLAWFAVHPDHQRQGLGTKLLQATQTLASKAGYTAMFIETYDHPDFKKARSFYESQNFTPAGKIQNYLPDNSPMIVYRKNLAL